MQLHRFLVHVVLILMLIIKNRTRCVITQFLVWAKPNPSHKCVTQLGTTITITIIYFPLILVKDKSNTREASRVTLGGLRWKVKIDLRIPL